MSYTHFRHRSGRHCDERVNTCVQRRRKKYADHERMRTMNKCAEPDKTKGRFVSDTETVGVTTPIQCKLYTSTIMPCKGKRASCTYTPLRYRVFLCTGVLAMLSSQSCIQPHGASPDRLCEENTRYTTKQERGEKFSERKRSVKRPARSDVISQVIQVQVCNAM